MQFIEYIPIITTIFSIFFGILLYKHWRLNPQAKHIMWWFLGVVAYGGGTLTESLNTIIGWTDPVFRSWYILGALMGGFPLATGTVYLLMKAKSANIMTYTGVSVISIAAVCVLLTPLNPELVGTGRLSGQVMEWQWVRYFSPFINIYAFIFLFGGAIYSAVKYLKVKNGKKRFLGNIFIGIGALLPGIGGSFTRFGHVEVLYVTEFLGLLMIYYGYQVIVKDHQVASVHEVG